jgi:hypothetical protein
MRRHPRMDQSVPLHGSITLNTGWWWCSTERSLAEFWRGRWQIHWQSKFHGH